MKKLILLTLSLITIGFSNNYGKIDMHGGKGDSLIGNNKKDFTKSSFHNEFDELKKQKIKKNKANKKKKRINKICKHISLFHGM
ncbi:hypothetical protein CRU96_08490 [Malaciobacter halophilus]|nr:hypothetical protein [Malaciobacter halophilus]RYA23293.1 hypothetical protein CRU96_08490 [Malaciobacter halophilus]